MSVNTIYIHQQLKKLADEKNFSAFKNCCHNEKEKQAVIEQADSLLKNIFVFNKTWDMERCKTPYHLDPIDWNTINNNDEEWCFMLSRMDYLSDLGLAYLLTGNLAYLEKGKALIFDFIEKHPVIKYELSTRTLDTAIRLMNWVQFCTLLIGENQLSEKTSAPLFGKILQQIDYLKANYLLKYITSNWGSIQTTTIVSLLPLLDENYQANEIYQWAYNEMKTQLTIQVYPDGMFWEQSTMYHVEVLNYAMKAMYFHKRQNDAQEEWFKPVKKLADCLMYQLAPNGEIEAFGDSDRVVARDVFHRAAVLFNEPSYKFVGENHFDLESLYAFGTNFAEIYEKMPSREPQSLVYDGNDGGMFTVRNDWTENASFTQFIHGSLGSGHGHSDNLHLSLFHGNEWMLIDKGRFTYREDHPMRVQLKGAFAHNQVILDEKPYCVPKDSWGYQDFGIPSKTYVKHEGDYHYFEGSMIGHDPLQMWTRKVVVINPNIWLVVDDVKADGNHQATLRFHADPFKTVSFTGKAVKIQGKNTSLQLWQDLAPSILTERCSLQYNELLDHSTISYRKAFTDETQFITPICDSSIQVEKVPLYQAENETPESVGVAVKFILPSGESYTVAVYHKEIFTGKKVLFCEGVPFHGKCLVVHEKDGKKDFCLLKA